jgi:pSer/pThr/pTyr-binding forkhead associated (FHA) protein
MGKIRYTTPDGIEQLVDLNEFGGHVTIGRTPDCAVYANSLSVSRSHAQVWMEDNQYHLLDLNSSNGTFLNGRKIEKAILAGGDLIKCGEFTMVFEDDAQVYRNPSLAEEINPDDAALQDAGPSWEDLQQKDEEINRLQNVNAELEDKIALAQDRVQALEEELVAARAQATAELTMARASQEQELEAAQQDISALTAQNNQLTSQIQSLSAQNAQLTNQSKDIGNQSSQLNAQLKDATTQNKDLNLQLKELSTQQRDLLAQLKEREDELDKLRRVPVGDGILPAEELKLRQELLSIKEELHRLRRSPTKNVS